LLEGERLVAEALREGVHIETVVGTNDFWSRRIDLVHQFASAGIRAFTVSTEQMSMLAVTEHSAGVLAVVSRPVWIEKDFWGKAESACFLGLLTIGIQDPGNLGTLIRTMAAAGGSGIILSPGNTEIGSPKILRSSAGAVFRLPTLENVTPLPALQKLANLGVQTLAAVPKKGRPFTAVNLTLPTLFVLGGEGSGLNPAVIQACTQCIQIPMPGEIESLNVATAGSILIYEAVRQRRLSHAMTRRTKQ